MNQPGDVLTLDYQSNERNEKVTYPRGFQPPRVPRDTKRNGAAGCLFAGWFAFCGLVTLGFVGVIVWAVVELVLWITSQ